MREKTKRVKWLLAAVAALAVAGTAVAVAQDDYNTTGHGATPWQTTPTPVAKGDLTAVTALAANDVYAVGYRTLSVTQVEAVLLHWDGTAWTQHSTLPANSWPQSLDVRSANDIWAAGGGTAHWDGAKWTSFPLGTPPVPGGPPPSQVLPDAVASAADGLVWVAGRQMGRDGVKTGVPAISEWDGAKWVAQTLPAGLGNGELTGLSVVSETDVWAAGSTFAATEADAQKPVLLHWDGTTWTKADAPAVPNVATWLSGVTAFSANDVWAVGGSYADRGDRPYALHFDGRKWTVTNTPQVPDGRLRVLGKSAGELWALGGKGAATVALRWTGRNWTQTPAPDLVLRSFTTVPNSATLWAVGVAKDKDLVPVVAKLR